MEELTQNWGSSHPLRFLISEKINEKKKLVENLCHDSFTIKLKNEERCLSCEASEHIFALSGMDLDHPDTDLLSTMKEMHGSLMWILENINWPDGNKW